MAIAYYIPDQSKLAGEQQQQQQQQKKPKLINNFKVPLNNYTLATNTCWELIARVFCYALRYHQLSAGNGILQISIEYIPPPHNEDSADKN